MLDPSCAATISDCLVIATEHAGSYPLCLGWQSCLEPLLPPLPDAVNARGRTFRCCIAFFIDDDIGPHFVFDEGGELEELQLEEVGFTEQLSATAKLWLRAYDEWRQGRLHRHRVPLRLVQ